MAYVVFPIYSPSKFHFTLGVKPDFLNTAQRSVQGLILTTLQPDFTHPCFLCCILYFLKYYTVYIQYTLYWTFSVPQTTIIKRVRIGAMTVSKLLPPFLYLSPTCLWASTSFWTTFWVALNYSIHMDEFYKWNTEWKKEVIEDNTDNIFLKLTNKHS